MRKTIPVILLLLLPFTARTQTTLDTAVNFSVKDITGYTHKLYNILDSGYMVVIDFFSTSCGPCATYAPAIQASYQNFGMNTGNVYFLGIAWGDDNQGVHSFDSTYGITYPSVSGMQGNGNQVVLDYNILSYPTVILIMPDRSIREKHIWPPTTARIDSILIANGAITTGSCPPDCLLDEAALQIWPNPARELLQVRYTLNARSTVHLSLIDMQGRVYSMARDRIQEAGTWEQHMDVGHFPPGLYLLQVQQGAQRITRPLILQ